MIDLMDKMSKKNKKKDDHKKTAKMDALKDLHQMASGMMGGQMKDMQKVTVAAKDKKGLKQGLNKAKELLGK